ncbi:UDP-3-O-(3-hydroxymyristoyl)glucosamine N-acyltransferase [bacterium]|nr:UDP-3-O-(3-hydroxymyristoyl)glucosamine N-acyltransferase [bacterium]
MADQNLDRFTPLHHIWPDGPAQLISELESNGFGVEFHSDAAKSLIEAHWEKLQIPRSLDSDQADLFSYCYIKDRKSKAFRAEVWGLVFCENNANVLGALSEAAPALVLKHADAALDFVLRKVHPKMWTGTSSPIPERVQAEAGVVIGPNCEIAEDVILEAGVRLGAFVKIGPGTRIGANSCVYDYCQIGSACEIKAQSVIGGRGFGFLQYPNVPRPIQRVHVGRVVIGDYVRIGSLVGVDRGVFEDTTIKTATAIDNFVQVAHNCELGAGNVLCGFVGLSGSTKMGDQVTIGGMSGTAGHLKIGNNVMIAGQTGVSGDVASNSVVKGYPPRPLKETLKIEVLTGKLPEIYNRLKAVEEKLKS